MPSELQEAQQLFLTQGGIDAIYLRRLRKDGVIADGYAYHEYPKLIRVSKGKRSVEKSTLACDKSTVRWTEEVEDFEDILVSSEEEEERVTSGGKTNAALEEERQALINRCRSAGVRADPTWSVIRLRRELGEVLNEAPKDEMGGLKLKLAQLEEMAAMKAKIAALEAKLSAPDEATLLRDELTSLGVRVDGRWSVERMRMELERATGPGA